QKGRRRSARREMKLRARGAPGTGAAEDVLIRNLSTTGMLLEAGTKLAVGQRIRAIRLARRLSLVEFAQKMNVSRPTVWAWEAGKSTPRPRKRQQLLQVLEVNESELQGLARVPVIASPGGEALSEEHSLKSVVEQAKATVAAAA